MKKILAFTVIATIFTFNIASANPTTGKDSKTKSTTSHTTNVKKMKDTDDQLMSQHQNTTADYFNTKSC